VDLYLTLGQNARAVTVGLDYLRGVGIDCSPHPTEQQARAEYQQIWSLLGDRAIEDLVAMPLMSDAACLATLDVLTRIFAPAGVTDTNLMALVACRAVSLSLEHGNCDASCAHYAWLGRVTGGRFDDYQLALRFGRLACDLIDRYGLTRFQSAVYLAVGGNIVPWVKHVRAGRELIQRASEAASRTGDLVFEAYSLIHLNANALMAGDPLAGVQRQVEASLDAARRMKFRFAADVIGGQLAYVRTLRGSTRAFGSLDDQEFDEAAAERAFAGNPDLAGLGVRKLQARFVAGDYTAAIDARSRAERQLWALPTEGTNAEFHFYGALSLAACCSGAAGETTYAGAIRAHHNQLWTWEQNCPENFEHRTALVGAEIARIERREADAMHLFEHAIRAASTNGFVHHEAIACELAARFCAARGFDKIAQMYLREARYGYLRWGADAKVRQLDENDPYLVMEGTAPGPTSTISASVERLDLETVIKVSQAVSGEIELEKMLDSLMRTAIEHAGAERGLLILSPKDQQRIVAEATTSGGEVAVRLTDEPVTAEMLPESILHYVLRIRDAIVVGEAASQPAFAADLYLKRRRPRSIVCLPLIAQAKIVGVLYLENNQTFRVFTSASVAVLKLLASQAAIALENARLYRELAAREANIRRLVDSNIVGITIFAAQGRVIEANEALLKMIGYNREDLVAGRIDWRELTPPEWHEQDLRAVEMRNTGTAQPYEKEYFRKDRRRVPVLIGAAKLENRLGLAFVLDLTERKRVEAEALKMEKELARANRVATMGQLTASIAHEVKQPIAATVTNAQAALRFLDAPIVDLSELRNILADIAKDGNRAGEIINRIRDLIRKAPPRRDQLDLNGAIREVVELTRGEATKNNVSVRTELADSLPRVRGDRVELQQVVLNLAVNALEAMDGVTEGPRELLISTVVRQAGVLVSVRDSGSGLPAVCGILHHQAQRSGPRPVDLSRDRRSAWRTTKCERECAARRGFSVHHTNHRGLSH
jgi:PAS domain S-box-containing protein